MPAAPAPFGSWEALDGPFHPHPRPSSADAPTARADGDGRGSDTDGMEETADGGVRALSSSVMSGGEGGASDGTVIAETSVGESEVKNVGLVGVPEHSNQMEEEPLLEETREEGPLIETGAVGESIEECSSQKLELGENAVIDDGGNTDVLARAEEIRAADGYDHNTSSPAKKLK
jgi:hypothetical protein